MKLAVPSQTGAATVERGGRLPTPAPTRIRGVPLGLRSGGFTLIELVIVVGVLGILFGITSVSFRGLLPKQRLRTAARALATQIEGLRLSAVTRGLWMGISYSLVSETVGGEERWCYQVIPPPPEDFPDQPLEQRELLSKQYLPMGVRISRVILSTNQATEHGTMSVLFSPMGNSGSHIVVLDGEGGRYANVKLNAITGVIEITENTPASFGHIVE